MTDWLCVARADFGDGRTNFDLLYHHNDAVTRMPPTSAGLIEMGGNRTTLNNGVFNMSGTVLTFCGHPDYSHRPPVPTPLRHLGAWNAHMLRIPSRGLKSLWRLVADCGI